MVLMDWRLADRRLFFRGRSANHSFAQLGVSSNEQAVCVSSFKFAEGSSSKPIHIESKVISEENQEKAKCENTGVEISNVLRIQTEPPNQQPFECR